jgi:triacylglycerol lipase
VDSDGLWRPFTAQPGVQYEFAITAAGYATTHIDRNLFPRSCSIVKLRAWQGRIP